MPGRHWLLVPRNRRTSELAFYRCYAPVPVPLAVLVMVARRRWTIEEPFQTGKGLKGLDEHQVGWWTSWYRWTTLAVVTARERADQPTEPELAPLTLGEIRRLLVRVLIQAAHNVTHLLCWSAGDDVTRLAPGPAISGGKPFTSRDQDLRLEY